MPENEDRGIVAMRGVAAANDNGEAEARHCLGDGAGRGLHSRGRHSIDSRDNAGCRTLGVRRLLRRLRLVFDGLRKTDGKLAQWHR